ncbi:hypothetical protein B0H14DRAFT_3436485 [Mycena olivaceomarginata]|nr:hypothetical protein B0H14DRAFT_3436485 [Mycena olivaceomarginata]
MAWAAARPFSRGAVPRNPLSASLLRSLVGLVPDFNAALLHSTENAMAIVVDIEAAGCAMGKSAGNGRDAGNEIVPGYDLEAGR